MRVVGGVLVLSAPVVSCRRQLVRRQRTGTRCETEEVRSDVIWGKSFILTKIQIET